MRDPGCFSLGRSRDPGSAAPEAVKKFLTLEGTSFGQIREKAQ
jgi:hypothetical protein